MEWLLFFIWIQAGQITDFVEVGRFQTQQECIIEQEKKRIYTKFGGHPPHPKGIIRGNGKLWKCVPVIINK